MSAAWTTPRLDLRPLQADDRALYVALYTDASLLRHVAPALSAAGAASSFATLLATPLEAATGTRAWTLRERAEHTTIGLLGLVRAGDEAEVGALIRAPWQGRGYACEAIAALVRLAFADATLARLHTRHAAANAGALGLMAKLGFERVPAAGGDAPECRWELRRGDAAGAPAPR